MRGFGSVDSATRFCPAFEEQRQYFRVRRRMGERVALAEQRRLFHDRWVTLLAEVLAAEAQPERWARRAARIVVPCRTPDSDASK